MTAAVFDTNVFLQAILSDKGPARACLQIVLDDLVELITTDEMIDEVRRVLNRPTLLAKYPQLRAERSNLLLISIFSRATRKPGPRRVYSLERDPADEVFLNLAIEAGVDHLVTRDRDLLDLMENPDFAGKFTGLKIIRPEEFLEVFRTK